MGERTGIQWADSTRNLAMGCDGCELWRPARRDPSTSTGFEPGAEQRPDGEWWIRWCYAGVDTDKKTSKGSLKGWPPSFDQPTIFPERIALHRRWRDLRGMHRPEKPWLNGLERIVFEGDMGDYWTASLPLDWLADYLPAIRDESPHRHLFLTKRPDQAAKFFARYPLPSNCSIGTSITGPQDPRLRALGRIDSDRIFVSYEPILRDAAEAIRRHPEIRWWIIGGASGCDVSTDVQDIRDAVQAIHENQALAFVKQLGSRPFMAWTARGHRLPIRLIDRKGGNWDEWDPALRVREMPR